MTQSDNGLDQVIDGLYDSSHVLLSSHVRSDPDAIGSELGLSFLLKHLDRTVEIANHGGVDEHCSWLPGADQIKSGTADITGDHDTFVTVDCANRERLGDLSPLVDESETVINIDHHESNDLFGDVNWIRPACSSVGEMVFEIWDRTEFELSRDPAECIYTSIVSDTGQFAFPQTSARSHEVTARLLEKGVQPQEVSGKLFQNYERSELDLMSYVIDNLREASDCPFSWSTLDREAYRTCGTEPWDSQPYVQLVMQLKNVEVGLLLRRLRDPEVSGQHQGNIKGSLRSRGMYDVGAIAGLFGGGGHAQAAGFVVEDQSDMEQAERRVIDRIKEAIKHGNFKQ
jgi:phosphoesterase RecJ-like protein